MESFSDKLAVITGAGDGMGRSLARQLAAEGCHLALCDVNLDGLAETRTQCLEIDGGLTVSTHRCDVSSEDQLITFRDEAMAEHGRDSVELVFNNAGIGGAGSMIADDRVEWERTFDVCWGGVYLGTRTFLPLLIASDAGHLVNTASINGFFASVGPDRPHTAYSAAKFAVKGFSEALIADLRVNAPHVSVSVVMPGHIGTGIVANSAAEHGVERTAEVTEGANAFRAFAPTTADEAATVILDGVRAGQWRILVGADAHVVDENVRADPEAAYEPEFIDRLHAQGALNVLIPGKQD